MSQEFYYFVIVFSPTFLSYIFERLFLSTSQACLKYVHVVDKILHVEFQKSQMGGATRKGMKRGRRSLSYFLYPQ